MSAQSSNPESEELAEVVVSKPRFSLVWLIPIVAALIGLFVAWSAYSERGPTIEITFETAEDRILRSEGDWQDGGFAVGDTIRVSGTALNDGDYVIKELRSEKSELAAPQASPGTSLEIGIGVLAEEQGNSAENAPGLIEIGEGAGLFHLQLCLDQEA